MFYLSPGRLPFHMSALTDFIATLYLWLKVYLTTGFSEIKFRFPFSPFFFQTHEILYYPLSMSQTTFWLSEPILTLVFAIKSKTKQLK